MYLVMAESLWGHIGLASMIQCYQIMCFSNAMLITWTWSHPLTEIIVNVEQPRCQMFYLLCTLQWMGSQTFVKCVSEFSFKHTFRCGGGQWYGADRFCLFLGLGGKSNESETCGLALELDLNLWPVDLDFMISESEDMDLKKEDLDLPLWDLTTSLCVHVCDILYVYTWIVCFIIVCL